jgi:hypothetical protein
MSQRPVFCLFLILLAIAVAFSGCTSQQAAPATPVATQTVVPVTSAVTDTPAPVSTAAKAAETTRETRTETEKVILTTKGTISPTEFKTFDFKSMGDEYSQVGVKYKITLKADKPVIGFAVTRTQADQLQSNEMTPQYTSGSDKIQWGLITPYMSLEKVTDSTKTFTVETVNPYVYVVDARWMTSDNDYKTTAPFNYELTIVKITTPAADANAPTAHT